MVRLISSTIKALVRPLPPVLIWFNSLCALTMLRTSFIDSLPVNSSSGISSSLSSALPLPYPMLSSGDSSLINLAPFFCTSWRSRAEVDASGWMGGVDSSSDWSNILWNSSDLIDVRRPFGSINFFFKDSAQNEIHDYCCYRNKMNKETLNLVSLNVSFFVASDISDHCVAWTQFDWTISFGVDELSDKALVMPPTERWYSLLEYCDCWFLEYLALYITSSDISDWVPLERQTSLSRCWWERWCVESGRLLFIGSCTSAHSQSSKIGERFLSYLVAHGSTAFSKNTSRLNMENMKALLKDSVRIKKWMFIIGGRVD